MVSAGTESIVAYPFSREALNVVPGMYMFPLPAPELSKRIALMLPVLWSETVAISAGLDIAEKSMSGTIVLVRSGRLTACKV